MKWRVLVIAFLALIPSLAVAQIIPSGNNFTPGHTVRCQNQTCTVAIDAGGAAGSSRTGQGYLTELGITNTGTPLCINDALTNAAGGYHQFCVGANALGGGIISYTAYGGASALPLQCAVNGILSPCFGGNITGFPVAPNNTALKAATGPTVIRAGFAVAGDGGQALYNLSSSACSLNGGNGDGGYQVKPNSGTGCWIADFSAGTANVKVWGAVCDIGVTDDQAALNAAAAAIQVMPTPVKLLLPGSVCRSSATVVIPDYIEVAGTVYSSAGGVIGGSIIQCDLAVDPCVRVGAADNKPNYIHGISITRAAGTIPGGSRCLQLNGGNSIRVENVTCYRHAIGLEADATGAFGAFLSVQNLTTCAISQAHVRINGWPAAYITDSSLGCNGAIDVNGTSFVQIVGNWDAAVGTIHFTNVHFNQGTNSVVCGISFLNFTGSTNVVQDVEIIGGHMETAQNAFCSDSTVKGITNLQVLGVWIDGGWGGTNKVFTLNAATTINTWQIVGNSFAAWGDLTLLPTAQINDLKFTGNSFLMPISITGVSSSTLNMVGNTYDGVTLAGSFGSAIVAGISQGGSYAYTATGTMEIDIPGSSQLSQATCASQLLINGSSTGITTSANVCQWQVRGNTVDISFYIALTSKGVGNGAVTMSGVPFAASASNGLGMIPVFNTGMATVADGVYANAAAATRAINFYTQGATGVTALTDANLTNSSVLAGKISYLVNSAP